MLHDSNFALILYLKGMQDCRLQPIINSPFYSLHWHIIAQKVDFGNEKNPISQF